MDSRDAVVVHIDRIETPLGTMVAGATGEHLVFLEFADGPLLQARLERIGARLKSSAVQGTSPLLDALRAQLAEYFARARRNFDMPLRTPGTPFQMKVWEELTLSNRGTRPTVRYA